MDLSAQVYSPLQHCCVWLGAWLYGLEATDEVIDALRSLTGCDAPSVTGPDGAELSESADFLGMLRWLRSTTAELISAPGPHEPVLRLSLSGPGEDHGIGRDAAVIVRTAAPDLSYLLELPTPGSSWAAHRLNHQPPQPLWLMPGDADRALSQAANAAADRIAAASPQRLSPSGSGIDSLPQPRLNVGSLTDFYEAVGMPAAVPARAAQLAARVDQVAAIIEAVTVRAGDHFFDPQLLELWRPVRHGRMTVVSYSLVEFSRGAGN